MMLTKEQLRYRLHRRRLIPQYIEDLRSPEGQCMERLLALVRHYEECSWGDLERALKETPEWVVPQWASLVMGLKPMLFEHMTGCHAEPFDEHERLQHLRIADSMRRKSSSYEDFIGLMQRISGRSAVQLREMMYGHLEQMRKVKSSSQQMEGSRLARLYNRSLSYGLLDQSSRIEVKAVGSAEEVVALARHHQLWGIGCEDLQQQSPVAGDAPSRGVVFSWHLRGPQAAGGYATKLRRRWLEALLSSPWPMSSSLKVWCFVGGGRARWDVPVDHHALAADKQGLQQQGVWAAADGKIREAPEVGRLLGQAHKRALPGVEFQINPQPLVRGKKGSVFLFEWLLLISVEQLLSLPIRARQAKKQGGYLRVALSVLHPWQREQWHQIRQSLKMLPQQVDALWVVPRSWTLEQEEHLPVERAGDYRPHQPAAIRMVVGCSKEPRRLELAKKILEKIK